MAADTASVGNPASSTTPSKTPNAVYVVAGVVLAVLGVCWAAGGVVNDRVRIDPVDGIGVFAVLYVVAQGVERVVEVVVDLLSLFPNSPGKRKAKAVVRIRLAVAEGKAPAGGDMADTQQGRADIAFLAHGLSIALTALAINALDYGLLAQVGVSHLDGGLDRLFTTLAAAGGTKALHELISRVQKSKEAAETGS